MKRNTFQRILTALLALCMTIGLMVPAFAVEELSVSDYSTFVKELKVLEGYASDYAAAGMNRDANELVLNFIRTGVERYNDGNWVTLAGAEITDFVTYVEQQDAANGTTAMALRNIITSNFYLPNGDQVDFGHMFGTMNIAYLASEASADLGGWAGDLCDLLRYSKFDVTVPTGTVDEMAAYILENCFGVDADQAFGMDDFCGDMDAFYLNAELKKGGSSLSALMDAYFTTALSNADRAAYFMNNRFSGLETQDQVRQAVYNAYKSNLGLSVLESDRGLSEETDLRTACCYAFADYLFDLAGDRLEGDTGSEGGEGGSGEEDDETEIKNKYYSVYSSTSSNLAPGVTQDIKFAYTADNKQIAYYVATVDVNRSDLSVHANYKGNDPSNGWGTARVEDQMRAAVEKHTNPEDPDNYIPYYNVVAGVNGDFYNMGTGKPSGALVMEGVTYHPGNGRCFFAILSDGSAVIGSGSAWDTYAADAQEAVGGSAIIVQNGEIAVTESSTYYNNRASRTAVGITADGEVVLMVLDGRQEPFSCGGSLEEIAQIMIDAGCVTAMNLDGGGSSTFVSKPEGGDDFGVINSPSDGYPRSVSSSLMVVSTAVVSTEFDHANISTKYDYLTPFTSMDLKVTGVSISGHTAQIPENAVWQVSDETVGVVEDGVFTAIYEGLTEEDREKTVDVQLVVDGAVVGSKTLHVVIPNGLSFADDRITGIYGQPTYIGVEAFYDGNPVAYNEMDVVLLAENGGECDGFYFTGDESTGVRVATVYAAALPYGDVIISTKVQLYREDEAIFDFDNLTGGDRQLGWIRDITNAYTYDDILYLIEDSTGTMDLSYMFGLDMEAIEIPPVLAGLTDMLPGADAEDASAWNFLLQLAERVSVLTTVKVVAQFDMDLDVDISNLTIVNEYFELKSAVLDEATNTLTITCGWIDQTAAIDPATANPICILSGVKATPKDGSWNSSNQVAIVNAGEVSYDIYLRASSLYSFACKEENQLAYGLYPFANPDVIFNGDSEKGAHFQNTYATFEDSFVLDRSHRNGWFSTGNSLYYYVDNEVISEGIHKLPGFEDPANEYYYSFEADGSCTGTVTGLFQMDDGLHYAVAGEPKTGWHTVTVNGETSYYYFYPSTGAAADGVQTIDGYTYTFTDCVLTKGDLVADSTGTRYRWAGRWLTESWFVYEGKSAYARHNGYLSTGIERREDPTGVRYYFVFGDDGFWIEDLNGFYDYEGKTYLIDGGIMVEYPGLVLIDGDYYYFNSSNAMIKDCTYWISKNNGYMRNKLYTFDADGKMVMGAEEPTPPPTTPSVPTEPGVVLNGIVKVSEDVWYYYVNGVKTYAGLIIIDGDYYYVNSSCQVIHDCEYWISKNNGHMGNQMYTFDADGKMVLETDDSGEKLNGIVKETEDVWYYYVNGVKTYAGLIIIDGDYYYVNSSCQVIHGCNYWISKNNGYMRNKLYTFDADGKMVMDAEEPTTPPTTPSAPTEPGVVLNGIVKETEDVWYYYVNGVKTYAGLIIIDGDYYYVNSSCQVVHGCEYWISKNNGHMGNKLYTFDSEGKMVLETEEPTTPPTTPTEPEEVLNGIVKESEDVWYYYVNGVKTYAGLIIIDGDYYYVNSAYEVVHDCEYWISKNNGYMGNKLYTFDSEGKMVLETEEPTTPPTTPTEPEEVLNGIVKESEDVWYYYVNGVKTYAGLIIIDGDYYYVNSSCEVVHDCEYWISKNNGYMRNKLYTFDSEGKMVL